MTKSKTKQTIIILERNAFNFHFMVTLIQIYRSVLGP